MRVICHYKKERTITHEGVMKQSNATVNTLNATLTTKTPVLLIYRTILKYHLHYLGLLICVRFVLAGAAVITYKSVFKVKKVRYKRFNNTSFCLVRQNARFQGNIKFLFSLYR